MIVSSLDDFTEYEPHCEYCGEYDDVKMVDVSGKYLCQFEFHMCIHCRKKLIAVLQGSV